MFKSLRRNRFIALWCFFLAASLAACASGGATTQAAEDNQGQNEVAQSDSSSNQPPAGPTEYPHDTMEIVVPFGAGGGVDTLARGFARFLPDYLGDANVIVENWPGGGSREGSARFDREAEPNGTTTIFIVEASTVGTQLLIGGEYDATAWEPIAALSKEALAVVVSDDSPYLTMDDLIAAGRDNRLSYSSSGTAGVFHVQTVILGKDLDLNLNHVPFDGSSEAVRAVLGGDVDFMVAGLQNYLTSDGLRALALIAEEGDDRIPDVPTMNDLGHSVVPLTPTRGWFAPAGTSPELVSVLEQAARGVFEDPEFGQWAEQAGLDLAYLGSAEWGAHVDKFADAITRYRDDVLADME